MRWVSAARTRITAGRVPAITRSRGNITRAHSDAGESLSLPDTLREVAVTIVGFGGVILLIAAVVRALHG